jgi:host factor-I protein
MFSMRRSQSIEYRFLANTQIVDTLQRRSADSADHRVAIAAHQRIGHRPLTDRAIQFNGTLTSGHTAIMERRSGASGQGLSPGKVAASTSMRGRASSQPRGEPVYNTIAERIVSLCSFPERVWGALMEKQAQNIQDSFLNNARKDKIALTIYLMSGVKLSGRIKSFDKYSLVLETNNQEQLIFKHAISTVVTQKSSHSYASGASAAASSVGMTASPPHQESSEA